jgi:DNA-binding response OmpR family regulator
MMQIQFELLRGEMATVVFVVDDETVIATTLAAILRGSGFEAIAFTDPLEALLAAETREPDLLITDVMMPQLNGVDLGVQFKAIHPNVRVLLFSGQAKTSDLLQGARDAGHNFELLTKPIHPTDLLKAISDLKT